jgi:hypothetical protein
MGFMNARRLILASVVSLSSLTAGALLVVPAALAEELCPNVAARQGPGATLPDCRAYEQVTPLDKGDSPDLFPNVGVGKNGQTIQEGADAAEDGDHILLQAEASFEGGDAFFSSYVFSRGPEGWSTTSLSPGFGVHNLQAKVFDPANLAEVGVEDLQYNHIPGELEENIVANEFTSPGASSSTIDTLPGPPSTEASVSANGFDEEETMVGASTNLSHIVIDSYQHDLAPGDTGQDEHTIALYEWDGGGPCAPGTANCKLINVNSMSELISPCGAVLGQGPEYVGSTYHAVSSDGSKIIFTAPDPYASIMGQAGGPGCWNVSTDPQTNTPQVYMRLNGAGTVEVSAPNRGVSDPHEQAALYAGASADGSKVFFLTGSKLTADDPGEARELYEYNTEAPEGERLVRVSSGESGTAEGDVAFVGAISSDGSSVYFGAYGVLAKGASSTGTTLLNLYRYDTVTKTTTFVTQVFSTDYPDFEGGEVLGGAWYSENALPADGGYFSAKEIALEAESRWYTTANGQYLLFGVGPKLYRYSAADGSIVCVSCGSGPPAEEEHKATFNEHMIKVQDTASLRPISENGSYVFFETENALVPGTSDTKLHVYEWHEGKISLISSPNDPGNAYFQGSSADGSNVFFGTHAQLVPQDTDVNGDLYDARIDGGFVGLTPPQCSGTGCQGAPGAPPIFATPASVTFEGLGNFPPGSGTSAEAKKAKTKKAKSLTKAQELARALKACEAKAKPRRKSCAAAARRRYGSVSNIKVKNANRRGK